MTYSKNEAWIQTQTVSPNIQNNPWKSKKKWWGKRNLKNKKIKNQTPTLKFYLLDLSINNPPKKAEKNCSKEFNLCHVIQPAKTQNLKTTKKSQNLSQRKLWKKWSLNKPKTLWIHFIFILVGQRNRGWKKSMRSKVSRWATRLISIKLGSGIMTDHFSVVIMMCWIKENKIKSKKFKTSNGRRCWDLESEFNFSPVTSKNST